MTIQSILINGTELEQVGSLEYTAKQTVDFRYNGDEKPHALAKLGLTFQGQFQLNNSGFIALEAMAEDALGIIGIAPMEVLVTYLDAEDRLLYDVLEDLIFSKVQKQFDSDGQALLQFYCRNIRYGQSL